MFPKILNNNSNLSNLWSLGFFSFWFCSYFCSIKLSSNSCWPVDCVPFESISIAFNLFGFNIGKFGAKVYFTGRQTANTIMEMYWYNSVICCFYKEIFLVYFFSEHVTAKGNSPGRNSIECNQQKLAGMVSTNIKCIYTLDQIHKSY